MKKCGIGLSRVLYFAIIAISSLYGALYLEIFYESYAQTSKLTDILHTFSINGALLRLLGLFVLFCAFCLICRKVLQKRPHIADLIFKYRYLIGIVVLAILVVFEISGSSVAYFADAFGYEGDTGTLFGHARAIRSDEYSVFTPMCVSQTFNNFDMYSDYLTGYPENMTMTYGSPTLSVVTLFRPFLWGYILFGAAKGLSFYWCARLIALFLVTFEFGRILTKDNRTLSIACAILVTFSPMVQWWYGTAFTVEILFSGEALCVSLYYMLAFRKSSIAFAGLIPWLCGIYLFALYPAWQVPCFYVFALTGVLFAIDRVKLNKTEVATISKSKVFSALAISLLVFGAFIGYSLYQGMDVIAATGSSVYPGSRFETGGGLLEYLASKGQSPLLSLNSSSNMNQCEMSDFFILFPFAIIIGLFVAYKKKDKYLISFSILMAIFLIYGLIGFPEVLAKMTLLSNIPTKRLGFEYGLLAVFILIRSLCLLKACDLSIKSVTVLGVLLLVNVAFIAIDAGAIGRIRYVFTVLIGFICLFVLIFTYSSFNKSKKMPISVLLVFLFAVVAIPGLCINPIQKGIDVVDDLPETQEMIRINDEDPGYFASNYTFVTRISPYVGVKSFSLQVYPLRDLWKKIDPDAQNEYAWNRYAAIHFFLKESGNPDYFKVNDDSFAVNISIQDLKNLGAKYYCTPKSETKQVQILDENADKVGETDMFAFYKL